MSKMSDSQMDYSYIYRDIGRNAFDYVPIPIYRDCPCIYSKTHYHFLTEKFIVELIYQSKNLTLFLI